MRAGAEDEEDDAEEDPRNGWERLKGEVLRRTEWRGRGRKENQGRNGEVKTGEVT